MKIRNMAIAIITLMMVFCMGCGSSDVVENDYNVDGVYEIAIASGEDSSTIFTIEFDKSKLTYTQSIQAGELKSDLPAGTYEIDEENDKVICTSESGSVEEFIISGKMLIAAQYVYEGKVPEGKTFDVEMAKADGSGSVKFTSDGKYVGSDNSTGTYERDGNYIKRTADDGSILVDFVIIDSGISNSYFVKK